MMTSTFQTMLTIVLLSLSYLSFLKETNAQAKMIECKKKDECSCVMNTKPEQEISLWKLQKNLKIYPPADYDDSVYAVDLCHHDININGERISGCQKSAVCRYFGPPKRAYELGHGSVNFTVYENVTKTMEVHYVGKMEGSITRSITLLLVCNPNILRTAYENFGYNVLHPEIFTGTITSKEICPIPVQEPRTKDFKNKGLSTLSIVLIVMGSFIFVCLCFFAVYSLVIKRKRSILDEDENNKDYGTNSTPPDVHVQNAASSSSSKRLEQVS